METLKVVARAEPSDRILILNGLRAKGEKVAFVGKGPLDLPALESAYVSYSVESSAQVIKERTNMGLMDASLSAFINSVIWGRNLYNNIQRFLQFQITCNFSLLVTILVGYIYLTESPLNAVQLLWINIIMEVLATLALSTVPPKPSMIKAAPSKQGEKLLSQVVWRSIYSIGFWNVIVMSVLIFFGKQMHGLNYGSAVQTTDTYHGSSDLTFDAE
jgi:magnesium-transporting ATPase (P-type)